VAPQLNCPGPITRYYYDQLTKQCKSFGFGRCAPNENNFLSLADCQKACPTQESELINIAMNRLD
jgi:hypothetical protein